MNRTERIFASTTPGLEPALWLEAKRLGEATRVTGGVELEGAPGLHRRANLELRIASRVSLELLRVPESDLAALAKLRWDSVLTRGQKLDLDIVGPQLRRAIPKSWPLGKGGLPARVRAEAGTVIVSVDTSGELLHRRGYRQELSHAPLRESLAAGLLLLAEYDASKPLWDPMCGSGTIAIEAAWMALGRAPGLDRTFAFEKFPSHDARAWAREQAEARARIGTGLPAPIFASDKNAGALGVARRNARRAGVEQLLQLARFDATVPRNDLTGPGLVIANLPYGKRVGEDAELRGLYRDFASALKQGLPGWRVAWLVADARLLDVGIAWQKRLSVENGGIRCTVAVGQV